MATLATPRSLPLRIFRLKPSLSRSNVGVQRPSANLSLLMVNERQIYCSLYQDSVAVTGNLDPPESTVRLLPFDGLTTLGSLP
jgi:hypothetical protein